MRSKRGSAFAVSPDASSVRFELAKGEEKPVLFDLTAASLTDSPDLPSRFAQARTDGLPITDWHNNPAPKLNDTRLALDLYERSLALAVRPDASGFVLGADWSVRAYEAKGEQRWNHSGPGTAWGVDLLPDGEMLAVAYDDGTIRWLRWSDGAELLALFVEPQSRKWVAWTPSGYYMASAGGEDLIGWHVNRGWDQQPDFFSASQFRAQYNRPDIVRLVLQTRDEGEAVRQANKTSDRSVPAKPVAAALPPVVTISRRLTVLISPANPSKLPMRYVPLLASRLIGSTCWPTASRSAPSGLKGQARAKPRAAQPSLYRARTRLCL